MKNSLTRMPLCSKILFIIINILWNKNIDVTRQILYKPFKIGLSKELIQLKSDTLDNSI